MAGTALARPGKVQVVRVTTPSGLSRGKRAGKALHRGLSAAASIAREETQTLTSVGTGFALGWAKGSGNLDRIPHIASIGVEGSVGLVAYIAGRKMKSKLLRGIGTGAMTVAAHEMGETFARRTPARTTTTGRDADGGEL
jgi:hypothetical protein